MVIEIMPEEKIDTIATQLDKYGKEFKAHDNSWLYSVLGESPFVETKYRVPDFELDMQADDAVSTDAENAKRVYERLNFFSESQAADQRLWAGLCLGQFYSYVQYRWPSSEANSIRDHYFYGYGARRSKTRNALARLWWIGRLTKDSSREDPYELTKFLCSNQNYIQSVLERNFSDNPDIVRPFLRAILDGIDSGLTMDSSTIKALSKYINLLGGVYILDTLDDAIIYQKTITKFKELNKLAKSVSE